MAGAERSEAPDESHVRGFGVPQPRPPPPDPINRKVNHRHDIPLITLSLPPCYDSHFVKFPLFRDTKTDEGPRVARRWYPKLPLAALTPPYNEQDDC